MLGDVLRDIVATIRRKPAAASAPAATGSGNPLSEYFYKNPGRGIYKWHNYFEIYHRHFAAFRGKSPVVVEIGVAFGGSLSMWHDYFGKGTRVVGIDVDPACSQFEDASTTIIIGDQSDRGFLRTVRERVPRIDILIDDGGHQMGQQIATFEELYPHMRPDGVYLCEDVHTSLLPRYGGGHLQQGTFLELCKALVDHLSSWHVPDSPTLKVDEITRSTYGIHFYDSIVVIEKRPMQAPRQFMTYGSEDPARSGVRFRP
jgi:cephalosporin hydroxylase